MHLAHSFLQNAAPVEEEPVQAAQPLPEHLDQATDHSAVKVQIMRPSGELTCGKAILLIHSVVTRNFINMHCRVLG